MRRNYILGIIMISSDKLQEIKQRFGIIGNAELLNRAIERAYLVAPTDYAILVVGESGVGKEFFPKIVHSFSNRKHAPYIAINCGAIPNGTIDSELFGHVKGSFTGALTDHKGYFEEANGGTIFLDEVGELPLETQVRLLRVLETGEFLRVGSSTVQKTNVRVVAATNVNLQQAISQGRFREDLFYRLSTITIDVPALRERKEDIPILFRKFAADCTERYNMPSLRLTEDAKTLLQNYYFRGNIRQLKNIAEQICVLEQRREINAETLHKYLPQSEIGRAPAIIGREQDDTYAAEREILYKLLFDMKRELEELKQKVGNMSMSDSENQFTATSHTITPPTITIATNPDAGKAEYEQAEEVTDTTEHGEQPIQESPVSLVKTENGMSPLQQLEKETIRRALEQTKGNRKQAAAEIGMSERTLYRKIKEYEL